MPQRSNLFKSHWSNQWLTFCAVTLEVKGGAAKGRKRTTCLLAGTGVGSLKDANCSGPVALHLGRAMPLIGLATRKEKTRSRDI